MANNTSKIAKSWKLISFSAAYRHSGDAIVDNTTFISLMLFLPFLGRLLRVDLIKWVSNVRPYVRPSKKVSSILMKFGMYVEVDERCMTVCSMTRSKVNAKVMSRWKSEIRPFSKAISSPIYNGADKWPRILKLEGGAIPKAYRGRILDFFPSLCVTWLWSWQYVGVDRQYRTWLIYCCLLASYCR